MMTLNSRTKIMMMLMMMYLLLLLVMAGRNAQRAIYYFIPVVQLQEEFDSLLYEEL